MEDIINEWTGELEGLSRGFMRHAAQLAAWDRHILSTRHSLLDLEEDLKKASKARRLAFLATAAGRTDNAPLCFALLFAQQLPGRQLMPHSRPHYAQLR